MSRTFLLFLFFSQKVSNRTPFVHLTHLNLSLYNHSENKGISSIPQQGVALTEQMSSSFQSCLCAFCFISQPVSGECTRVCVLLSLSHFPAEQINLCPSSNAPFFFFLTEAAQRRKMMKQIQNSIACVLF